MLKPSLPDNVGQQAANQHEYHHTSLDHLDYVSLKVEEHPGRKGKPTTLLNLLVYRA